MYDWLNRESLLSAAAGTGPRKFMEARADDPLETVARLLPKHLRREAGLQPHFYGFGAGERDQFVTWFDRLPGRYQPPPADRPLPGDAVRHPAGAVNVAAGAVGIVGGVIGAPPGDRFDVTWNHSTFRGDSFRYADLVPGRRQVVSCSGGPSHYLDLARVRPTGELSAVWVWQWREWPESHGGLSYRITVPLWELVC